MLLEAILARTATSQFTNYCKIPDALGGFDLRELAEAGASRLSSPSLQSSFTICLLHHTRRCAYLHHVISSIVPQVHSSAPTRRAHRGRLSSTRAKVPTRRTALAPPRSPSLSNTTTSLSKRVRSLWTLKKSTCSQCVHSPPLLSAAPTTAAARFLSLSLAPFHTRAVPLSTLTLTLSPPPPTTPHSVALRYLANRLVRLLGAQRLGPNG